MSKIKNGGLDEYGAEPFQQQQFGPADIEGVKTWTLGLEDEVIISDISYVTSLLVESCCTELQSERERGYTGGCGYTECSLILASFTLPLRSSALTGTTRVLSWYVV